MPKSIHYNNKPTTIKPDALPCILHGHEGSGASMFSVSLIASLYEQGENLLFLCGYHMARDEFAIQVGAALDAILVQKDDDVEASTHKRAIFVGRENTQLFVQLSQTLPDIKDRIVFIKNIELFDERLFEAVKHLPKLVISGDLDSTSFRARLMKHKWKTKILFSQLDGQPNFDLPDMPKYTGYLEHEKKTGLVSLG